MKKGLKFKLRFVAIVLIITPLITLTIGGYVKTKSIISNDLKELSISTLNGIESSIDTYLKGYEESLTMLSQNTNIKEIIDNIKRKPFMTQVLKDFIDTHKDAMTITLATVNKQTYIYPDRNIPTNHDLTGKYWYKETIEKKGVLWTQPYKDSYTGEMIVSACAPVYNKDSLVGVILLDISLDTLTEVMKKFKIGHNGYAYLIDLSGKIMAHRDKSYIGKEHSSSKVRELLKTQKESYVEYVNNENENRVAVFKTLDKTGWKIFGTIDTDEILQRSYSMIITALIIGLMSLLIVLPLVNKCAMKLIGYINSLLADIENMKEGDFTIRSNIKSGDELEALSQGFNSTVDSLVTLIKNVQDVSINVKNASENLAATAEETSSTAEEVGKNVEEISKGAVEQAQDAEYSETLANNLSIKINELTINIEDIYKSTNNVVHSNIEGLEIVKDLKNKTNENNIATDNAEKAIIELNRKSKDIEQILSTITEIATKTNLLALNASIEAARAGEYGKGFAVVAAEIRNLAEGSQGAIDEIQTIIKNIQMDTTNTVNIMNELKGVATEQDIAVNRVNDSFDTISEAVQVTNKKISLISNFVNEIDKEKDAIVASIKNMSAVSEETSVVTQEVNAAMEQQSMAVEQIANAAGALNELALVLNNEIDKFKI